jgi:predicted SprT family Zn-dependent metalloprotease
MHERFEAVRKQTQAVLARARELYGVDINPIIGFNLTGKVAGWASCKHCAGGDRLYGLRFNRQLIEGKHFQDILAETVPHEVAHLICFARPELGRKHDAGWRRVCLALGGNGKTRHDYDVVANTWDYITDLGHRVTIRPRDHARVQAGETLRFRGGKGTINRLSRHARSGQLEQAKPATPASLPTARPALASLAQRSWALLQELQAQGRTASEAADVLVRQLGLPVDSARYYVQSNWRKLAA